MRAPGLSLRLRIPLARFDLDLALETDARCLGIFGPSGAGKTTLLEAIAGWRRAREGRIALGERVLFDSGRSLWVPLEQRGIGYVPQDALLFPNMTVGENVEAGRGRGQRKGFPRADVERAIAVLEIGPLLSRPCTRISGGERQRVALARALCSAPDLLLLDEPLGGLDLALRRRILPYLIRVREAFEVPMILVSHDATEVLALCDEVAVLEEGHVRTRGPAREALRDRVRPHAGYDNVLRGTVVSVGEAAAKIEVAPGVLLVAPAARLRAGEIAVLALGADEILVSAAPPERISARNVHAARVESLEQQSEGVMLEASLGGGEARLWVALTEASTRELGLARGASMHLVFKTQSVRVLSSSES